MQPTLPRWNVRLDAFRPINTPGWSDFIPTLSYHYQLHEKAVEFLGPYNAKQRSADHYMPPTRDILLDRISQGRVNYFTYTAFINSLVKFCEITKGHRALPTPHPSVVHSIQLPLPAFELHKGPNDDKIIKIIGINTPVVVKGLRVLNEIKFIIIRPKLAKLGTPSSVNWEVLFYRHNHGYIPEWVDTNLNPRWSGCF